MYYHPPPQAFFSLPTITTTAAVGEHKKRISNNLGGNQEKPGLYIRVTIPIYDRLEFNIQHFLIMSAPQILSLSLKGLPVPFPSSSIFMPDPSFSPLLLF